MSALSSLSLFDETLPYVLSRNRNTDTITLVRRIWTSDSADLCNDEAAICAAFVRHVKDESLTIKHHEHCFATCTLDEITDLIGMLQDMSSRPLTDIVEEKRKHVINIDEASIQRTLELCIRLWLTINVNTRAVAVGGTSYREQTLDWSNQISLLDLTSKAFIKNAKSSTRHGGPNIDGIFTAHYLVNSCGLEVAWTNYLTDHLRLDASRRVLLIFRHKPYLNLQCDRSVPGPVSRDVYSEALDTLNLLFPFGKASTKQLLIKHDGRDFYDFGMCGRKRVLDLERYEYWREELEALLEIFESPPRTWRQLAVDRRNKLEWSAFWVTVMVAFLTLVSIPCSIIQAVYSVKSYHLALAQNNSPGRNEQ